MSVLILHLSDLHMESDTDPLVRHSQLIASALNSRLSQASAIYIVVSGDIAESGQVNQRSGSTNLNSEISGYPAG